MNIKELREKSLRIAHEARDLIPTIAEDGNNSAEVEAKFDAMMLESDALAARADRLDKVEAREKAFGAIETEVRNETVTVEARGGQSAEERYNQQFISYMRGDISGRELRAQSTSNTEGGYTIPTTLSNSVIVALKAYGPMNDGGPVTYLTTSGGNPIQFPTMNDTSNAGALVGEATAVSDAAVAFGQTSLGAYKFTSNMFKVSSELLSDSAVNIVEIVNAAMAERLGRAFNTSFTTGTGSSQPQGIVTATTSGKTAASATAIAFSELIDLEHSIDPAYRTGSSVGYMFADSTLLALRKLVDGQGRPLWQAGYTVGAPDTINNRPYWINTDMASIATGVKSVLFGDFSKFTVRRAGGFVLRRLDERYADSDQVGFVAFVRADSKLLDTRAIRALTQA